MSAPIATWTCPECSARFLAEDLHRVGGARDGKFCHGGLPVWADRVVSRTERHATGVSYAVSLEDETGDSSGADLHGGHSWLVWSDEVFFGATDSHCAGGTAFVEMARKQEQIAEKWSGRIRSGSR